VETIEGAVIMLRIFSECIGDTAILQCEGAMGEFEAASILRHAMMAQKNSSTIVVDLSGLAMVTESGVGTLIHLQRWAQEQKIKIKFFNPTSSVRHLFHGEFASLREVMDILQTSAPTSQLAA
jgi:anti-anti-sigma regulatory factor